MMELTESEQRLATEIEFSQKLCAFIKRETNETFERAYGIGEASERYDVPGLSIMMPNDRIEAFIRANQAGMLAQGYRAFWSERTLEDGLRPGDELLILKTTDHLAVIALRQTDGANYDVFTKDILERIRQWERACSLTVVGAATDWVAMEFESLPADLCAFADEIYQFCPDTVEQGIGLKDEADAPEFFAAARRGCPEASRDLGVKLLAHELQKSKYLFLWWD